MTSAIQPPPDARSAEIEALVEVLHQTDNRLEQLLHGEVDAVMSREGKTIVLRRAQSHLRESEVARQAAILNALPVQIALLDARGEIVSSNTAWRLSATDADAHLSGHAIGSNYLAICKDLVSADFSLDALEIAGGVEDVLRGVQSSYTLEYATPAAAGHRCFRLHVTPSLQEVAGGVVVMHTDITESQQAADARSALSLRTEHRERMLTTMLSSIADFTYVFNRAGRFVFANQPLLDLWGIPLEEAVGKNFHDLNYPPDLANQLQVEIEQVFSTGVSLSGETPYEGAAGTPGYYEYIFSPALAADGSVDYVVGSTRDFTASRASNVALQESIVELRRSQLENTRTNGELSRQQQEMRVLFDLVPASIAFKDTSSRLLRVNERMARMAGKSVVEMEGELAARFFPDQGDQFAAEDLEIISTGESRMGIVQQRLDGSGNRIWVRSDKVPYLDEHGKVIGIAVMSLDITQQKLDQDRLSELNTNLEGLVRGRTAELSLAREEAERANGAKSEFLATMSHEIRTPMSGLLGLLELLGLTELSESQHSTLAAARHSGSALLHIIDDILDFSKIEANCLELNPVAASVKDVLQAACHLHSQIASSKNLGLGCVVSPEVGERHVFDPLRLGQILNNFVNNAIKFTEVGNVAVKVERLSTRDDREELRFSVCDTGIGMTDEEMQRLFHPFAQAGRGTTARFGGTGLGLVIARRLADLMGGQVDIHSQRGIGTVLTLTVEFQVCATDGSEVAPMQGGVAQLRALTAGRRAAPPIESARREGSLLLVVDDHPINRRVLLGQVASLGYAAESANDGVEGFEAWKTGRYGAIITDCNMPRMSGYEFAQAVRLAEAASGAAPVPIIGCTANALPSAAAMCMSAGMSDCVVKPADLLDISRKLDRWLPLDFEATMAVSTGAFAAIRTFTAAATGLLDSVLLTGICRGDVAVQAEILRDFRRANELDAAALRQCAAAEDFPGVVQASHRMKGSSLMLGSTLLAHACAEVEAAAAARHGPRLKACAERLETELLRLNLHLSAVVAAAPPAAQAPPNQLAT